MSFLPHTSESMYYLYLRDKRYTKENDLMSLHNNYACKGFTLWNIHIKTIHKGSFYLPFMNKETNIQSCKRTNKCIKNTSCVWIWDLNTNKTIWRNKTSSSVVYINIDNVPSSPIFHLISWHNYEYCSIHKCTFIIVQCLYGNRNTFSMLPRLLASIPYQK